MPNQADNNPDTQKEVATPVDQTGVATSSSYLREINIALAARYFNRNHIFETILLRIIFFCIKIVNRHFFKGVMGTVLLTTFGKRCQENRPRDKSF